MNNQEEVWLPVKGYEGLYEVSNLGNVKSFVRGKGKVLKCSLTDTGYYRVNLHKNGVQRNFKVHKLVAISFLNHTPCGYKLVVDHIDNNPLNNNLDNLQLITNRENSSKDKIGGTSKYIGVSLVRRTNKWKAQIRINGNDKFLGHFDNEIDASKAYQKELKELIKEYKQKNKNQ